MIQTMMLIYSFYLDSDARQVYRDYDICPDSLGEGSFGKVSLATHRKTGQRRVCKTIGRLLDDSIC